jgi:Glycosyltransferase
METTASGGINKAIREIAKHLSIKGHSVTVLQANSLGLPYEEIYEGFKIIRVKSKFSDKLYGFHPEFYSFFKKNVAYLKPDIVHVHGYHTLFSPEVIFILKVVLKINTPIVFTCHYDPLNRSTLAGKLFGEFYNKLIGARLLKSTTQIVSVSNFEANNINRISKCDNIVVIPHGVDFIDISKAKSKKNFLKLLYVGYLLDYKGVQYIIDSLHELTHIRKIQNIKLTIVGEGKYKKQLLLHSRKLNVSDYIEWKPFLPSSQVINEMKNADVFLLLSKSEGYGIVVAEALAVGTPTIVTKGTALEEFINEPGCFGVEFPPRPENVAELILNIYNSVKVGPFSNKIRTWDKVANDYEKIYKKCITFR